MKSVLVLLLIGILFVLPQVVFAQTTSLDEMMNQMRFTHSQLSNNTSEATALLDGMEIRINHMNTMFNDLVWELSNKGH